MFRSARRIFLHIVYNFFQDIPAENRSYMLRNLKPARNYTLSIQMINNIGAGPAKYVTVTTPTEPEGISFLLIVKFNEDLLKK